MPTAADADCRTAVKRVPTRMPSSGFFMEVIIPVNQGCSPRPLTAPLMVCMPSIRTAKPSRISPMCFFCTLLQYLCRIIPAIAMAAVRVLVERILLRLPVPSI